MKSSHLLHLLLPLILLAGPQLAAGAHSLPQAVDLQRLGDSAEQRRIPILLMISQYHCSFCELMKREVLNPMRISGDYTDRVLMRELLIDPGETVTNFDGHREAAESFSSRYQVQVTPTLLFLDGDGNEVAERILGINTIDYLLFYIEEAIETATKTMLSEAIR
ncbi:MAG: thioredoxin fold domain-containing protein [Chromatiales bacterium]|jgi:thioredoxin-related protein